MFTYVISNPPYQKLDRNSKSSSNGAVAMYPDIVLESIKKVKKGGVFIIPARWVSAGRGTDKFREKMLHSSIIKKMIIFPNSKEIFPEVNVEGGIMILHIDKNKKKKEVLVRIIKNGTTISESKRILDEFDIFIVDDKANNIVKKVIEKSRQMNIPLFENIKGIYYGLKSNFKNYIEVKDNEHDIKVYLKNGIIGYINKKEIEKYIDNIDSFRLIIPRAYGPSSPKVYSKVLIADKNEVFSETFNCLYKSNNLSEIMNAKKYFETKFVRFLVKSRKITQQIPLSTYKFVPKMDFSKEWTDRQLYDFFDLTIEEIDLIERSISEMK